MDSDEEYFSSSDDETVNNSEEEEERDADTDDQHTDDDSAEGEGEGEEDDHTDDDSAEGEGEEEEGDADTDDDTDDSAEEGEGDAVQTSQPQQRPRRKRTVTKWPEDKIVVTELTEVGTPKEENARARMTRLAGLIARQRISLVLSSFSVLTDQDKMDLFDDCVQPWLEFADELKEMACKKMMQMVAKAWRTHKSHLVSCYVNKGLDATMKHTYINPEVWEEFVIMKQGTAAKKISMKFKKLRDRNKHDHHLGTGGYAGKLAVWEKEDKALADAGIANPWDQFPGRARNFMRARGRLVVSEGVAVIDWETKEAENLSYEVVNKQAEIDSSGAKFVRDKDVLTQALGRPEQTGRIRGMSSSIGWQFWPLCADMYKKRKRSDDVDVEAIKGQVVNEITEKVTNDIMARLCAAGVNLNLLSNTPSSVGGKNEQLDRKGGISGQVSPSPCTLVIINPEGYQVEVATGRVFPNLFQLYSVQVAKGYVVVHIDSVVSEHAGHVLPHSSNEIRTLGDALYKRIQWRREWVVVSQRASSSISAKHPILRSAKGRNVLVEPKVSASLNEKAKASSSISAKHPILGPAKSRNVLMEPKVSPSLNEKANVNSPTQNCASMMHVGNKQKKLKNTMPLTAPRLPPSSEKEYLDLPCTLVIINNEGYQVEVAKGRVFPNNSMINRRPVEEGYVVVCIEFICPGQEGHVLLWCQSKDARTLGACMYKRIQWKREWVVVSPQLEPSISAKPPTPGSAKSNVNVLVEPKVSPLLNKKENVSTVQNASMAHVVDNNENKLTNTNPATVPRRTPKIAKGVDTKQVQKVVDTEKQQGQSSKAAKQGDTKQVEKAVDKQKQQGVKKVVRKQSSEHARFQSNPDFIFGQPMLPESELDKAGPGCVALHAHYMKACAQNMSSPFFARITSELFLHEAKNLSFPVGFEDIFGLFTLDGLEMSILRCLTLCLIVEARDMSLPVGLLDPDVLSVESISMSRDFSVRFLENGLRKHAKKEYVMFPYNSGDQWIAVIIIPKWLKVLYVDSSRGRKMDLKQLRSVIDEAFRNSQTKAKKKPTTLKLSHVPKTPCLQQPPDNTGGFYASYNMMLAMRQTNLDDSKV